MKRFKILSILLASMFIAVIIFNVKYASSKNTTLLLNNNTEALATGEGQGNSAGAWVVFKTENLPKTPDPKNPGTCFINKMVSSEFICNPDGIVAYVCGSIQHVTTQTPGGECDD